MVKLLISFTHLVFICCFLVSSQYVSSQSISSRDILLQNESSQNASSQDMLYTYEEPNEGLKFLNTVANSDGTLMIQMAFESEDEGCILPYFHLRLIEKTGQVRRIDLNYTFPTEEACPLTPITNFTPLTYNYIMVTYIKSDNGIENKYGLVINYSSEIIGEPIYLGSASVYFDRSIVPEKGFIRIEKPNENGIATWNWHSAPDIITGEIAEISNGTFYVPSLTTYTLVDSSNFVLIDGGFGYLFILKHNERMNPSAINDPNLQYWRVYVSFLREGTDSPTIPSLVYQSTKKLNNIEFMSPCTASYNATGYICIMTFNNTITDRKRNQSWTEVNYYQLGFLSTGAFERLDIIPKPTNSSSFDLTSLLYGGFLVTNYYAKAMDGYILYDDGSYMPQSEISFGPGFVHYNMFKRNNTFFGVKKQIGNKIDILLKPLPRIINHGSEYDNPVIDSTKPAINEVVGSSIEEITIKYDMPVKLSTANVSIYQLNDDPFKPSLLRQTISGDSKLCNVGSDNYTVHIPIFKSTFNQPNSVYYVVVENNFVISQARDEPLIGIKEKIWKFSIKPFEVEQHSDPVTGSFRLNEEGSLRFLHAPNRAEFVQNMIQEFSKIIPVNEERLTTNGKWQYDPSSPQKILLSININEAEDDKTEPNSRTIYDNLSVMIKRKDFTALSNSEYTSLIDESAPLTMTQNYFEKFFPLIIIFIVSSIVLTTLYFIARQLNPGGRNSAIFETAFVIIDFAADLAFTLNNVKNVPKLMIPNMVFFVVPIIVNCLFGLNIFIFEITNHPSFVIWFSQFPTLSSMFTLFSAIDIRVLNTLSSELFGLKILSAPLTQRSRKLMLWGSVINILIEDVPQLIIQGIYYNSVVTYDLIPSLALASGGLVIANKLILSSYHALVRWHHRRNKIRDSTRHLSIASLRSIKSNVEIFNEKKIEQENYYEEKDLTENISYESTDWE